MNGAFRASAMSADRRTYFWSAEQTDASNAPILEIGESSQQQFSFLKSVGLSVRCVWDEEPGVATPTDEAPPTSTYVSPPPPTAAATDTATPTIEPSDTPPTGTDEPTAEPTSEPTPTEAGEHSVYLPMAERGQGD